MFISDAFAQTTEAVAQTGTSTPMSYTIAQWIFIVLVVYFILLRPQQKRIKKHEAELKAIIKGTKVVVSGLIGQVVDIIDEDKLVVEFADGVQIQVIRNYVSQVVFDTPAQKK